MHIIVFGRYSYNVSGGILHPHATTTYNIPRLIPFSIGLTLYIQALNPLSQENVRKFSFVQHRSCARLEFLYILNLSFGNELWLMHAIEQVCRLPL